MLCVTADYGSIDGQGGGSGGGGGNKRYGKQGTGVW